MLQYLTFARDTFYIIISGYYKKKHDEDHACSQIENQINRQHRSLSMKATRNLGLLLLGDVAHRHCATGLPPCSSLVFRDWVPSWRWWPLPPAP